MLEKKKYNGLQSKKVYYIYILVNNLYIYIHIYLSMCEALVYFQNQDSLAFLLRIKSPVLYISKIILWLILSTSFEVFIKYTLIHLVNFKNIINLIYITNSHRLFFYYFIYIF